MERPGQDGIEAGEMRRGSLRHRPVRGRLEDQNMVRMIMIYVRDDPADPPRGIDFIDPAGNRDVDSRPPYPDR